MKRLIVFALLSISCVLPAQETITALRHRHTQQPITFVQAKINAVSGTSVSTTFTSNVTAGDFILILWGGSGCGTACAAGPTFTSTLGDTITSLATYHPETDGFQRIGYVSSSVGGADTITATLASAIDGYLTIIEYSHAGGVDGSVVTSYAATGNTLTMPSITTTHANDILVLEATNDFIGGTYTYSGVTNTIRSYMALSGSHGSCGTMDTSGLSVGSYTLTITSANVPGRGLLGSVIALYPSP